MAATPTLEDVIKRIIKNELADVHTMMPAKIVTYDPAECKVDVEPVIKTLFSDETVIDMPIIREVPVNWLRTSTASLTFPLAPGDLGKLIFSEKSIDKWITSGALDVPSDPRRFDLSDAVFEPGLYPFNESPLEPVGESVVLKFNNSQVTINPDGKIAIGNNSQELLDIVDQLLVALNTATVSTMMGPQPLSIMIDGTLATLISDLSEIKGVLA